MQEYVAQGFSPARCRRARVDAAFIVVCLARAAAVQAQTALHAIVYASGFRRTLTGGSLSQSIREVMLMTGSR